MAIEIETKDCTALTDAEMAEMADLCAEGPLSFEAGDISKQAQNWVLICQARESDKLRGFSFCTLERIGGTPSVIIGLASVRSTARRDAVLRALMTDQLYRALLAFPDEDVLVGARLAGVGAFDAFATLDDVVPRPDHKATGEERAWGRRLAKRFGHENGSYDDRAFLVTGDQQRYRTTRAVLLDVAQGCRYETGDAAFHVDGAAAIHDAVFDHGTERVVRPAVGIPDRHHVGMAGKTEVWSLAAIAGIEVFDIRRVGLRHGHAVALKARRLQYALQECQRAAFFRRDGWAAHEGLGQRDGVFRVHLFARPLFGRSFQRHIIGKVSGTSRTINPRSAQLL